jgi:hypothetical protein
MRLLSAIGFALCATTAGHGAAADYDFCTEVADCERTAKADLSAGRLEDALRALAAVADLATGAEDEQRLRSAMLLSTTTSLKLDKPLLAHAWAQATLDTFKNDPEAIANLKAVKLKLGDPPAPEPVTGTYLGYAGRGQWNEFKVVEQSSGRVRVRWFVEYFGKMRSITDSGPTHYLDQTAEGWYADGRLVVTYRAIDDIPCTLTFRRMEWAILLESPRPADLPDTCVFDSFRGPVFPFGPFWLVDRATPGLETDDE